MKFLVHWHVYKRNLHGDTPDKFQNSYTDLIDCDPKNFVKTIAGKETIASKTINKEYDESEVIPKSIIASHMMTLKLHQIVPLPE